MSRDLSRRRFLKLGSAAALGAGLTGCKGGEEEVAATGSVPFGIPREEQAHAMLAADRRAPQVLELFLMGGLCAWDSFYVVPEFGDPAKGGPHAGTQWWTFQEGADSVGEHFARCGGGSTALYEPFALDAAGRTVNLGPWLYPLRARKDLLARMRIFVLSHPFEPHQTAVPISLGGAPLMPSPGAHVQRYYQAHGDPARRTPYSYVLYPDSEFVAGFNVESASAVGRHPASTRPLAIRMIADNPLSAQLSRDSLGGRATRVDAAVNAYLAQYRAAMTSPTTGQIVRSSSLGDYGYARSSLPFAQELGGVLSPSALATTSGAECGDQVPLDASVQGLKLATHLLTSPEHAARYVHVIDNGLIPATNGGYDTHDMHVPYTARNLVHTMRALVSQINEPGEGDPAKLDLDKQMVFITTEMGRTPTIQVNSEGGLNHWPYGYVMVAIGGTIDEGRAGIVGNIREDGRAEAGLTPAEMRAAALLAMGIWPFHNDGFRVSDVRGATDEADAALRLREIVWGLGS